MDRFKVKGILEAEITHARNGYEKAHQDFLAVTADIPSGIPSPDGAHRIRNAGQRQTAALESYLYALRNLNGFLLDGAIPEHLRNSGE